MRSASLPNLHIDTVRQARPLNTIGGPSQLQTTPSTGARAASRDPSPAPSSAGSRTASRDPSPAASSLNLADAFDSLFDGETAVNSRRSSFAADGPRPAAPGAASSNAAANARREAQAAAHAAAQAAAEATRAAFSAAQRTLHAHPGYFTKTGEIGTIIANATSETSKLFKKKRASFRYPGSAKVNSKAGVQATKRAFEILRPAAAQTNDLFQALRAANPDMPTATLQSILATDLTTVVKCSEKFADAQVFARKGKLDASVSIAFVNDVWSPRVNLEYYP